MGTGSAFMDIRARVSVNQNNTVQLVFGFAEPTGGKQVFIGLASNRVEFASFNNNNGQWSILGLINFFTNTGQSYHDYRLRKIGTSSVALCVDGTQRLTLPYASLQAFRGPSTPPPPSSASTAGAAPVPTRASHPVQVTLGSDGGGC